MTLYRRLGGDAGIAGLVSAMSARLAADPVLGHYFRGVDLAALDRHRTAYFSALLGGGGSYTGRAIPAAHAPFRLGDREFDAFLRVLHETLDDSPVSAADARRIIRIVSRLREHVVSRGFSAGPAGPVYEGPDARLVVSPDA
jgi:hemoglobin